MNGGNDYWEELQAYRSPDGLVNIIPNQQNGAVGNSCYTWAAFYLANKLGVPMQEDFEKTISCCYVPNNPGLMYRSPSKKEEMEGWDDYTVAMAAAKVVSQKIANEMFTYAISNKFVLNCLNPGVLTGQSAMFRYPTMVAQFYYGVNKCPPFPIGALASAINAIPDSSTDGIVLSYFRRNTKSEYKDERMKPALSHWMAINGTPNIDHPLVKYWA